MRNAEEIECAIDRTENLFKTIYMSSRSRKDLVERFSKFLGQYSDPTLVAFSDFEHMRIAGEISRDITDVFSKDFGIPHAEKNKYLELNTLAGFFHDVSNIVLIEDNSICDDGDLVPYLMFAHGAKNHPTASAETTHHLLEGIFDRREIGYITGVIERHKNIEALGNHFLTGIPVIMADDMSTLVNYNRLLLSYTFNFLADIYQTEEGDEKAALIKKFNNYIDEFHEVTDKGPITKEFAIQELKDYKGVDLELFPKAITGLMFMRMAVGPNYEFKSETITTKTMDPQYDTDLFKIAISNAIALEEQIPKLIPGVKVPDYKRVENNYWKLLAVTGNRNK